MESKYWVRNFNHTAYPVCLVLSPDFSGIKDNQTQLMDHIDDLHSYSHVLKSKITKILNLEENQIGKSIITWQNQMTKHIKQMVKNCHFPDLVQAFSNVENGGLYLVI